MDDDRFLAHGSILPSGESTNIEDSPPYDQRVPSRTRAATYARRRKTRMSKVDHDLTDDQWQALMDAWGGCAYCGGDGAALQKDCMLPISRGGRYTVANVVPACASCNASKWNLEVTTWLRRKKLDERRFLLRQVEVLRTVLAGDVLPEAHSG